MSALVIADAWLEWIQEAFSQIWTEIDVGIADGDVEIADGNDGIAASTACTEVQQLSL